MNLAIIEPRATNRTIHHHTPLLLDGVSSAFNQRLLRQSEAAMGPAGFLLPDDAAAAERMQVAFGHGGGWMDLSRRADYDPSARVSYINDNRGRLETRVRQLQTGVRYAQTPQSPMRRTISNVEILEQDDTGGLLVGSNFVLYELSIQATDELRIWAGRATHRLQPADDDYRIRAKIVELVNSSRPLPTLAFLL